MLKACSTVNVRKPVWVVLVQYEKAFECFPALYSCFFGKKPRWVRVAVVVDVIAQPQPLVRFDNLTWMIYRYIYTLMV